MRRLARAVEGATTEAGAWKPDEAMVMREAAIVELEITRATPIIFSKKPCEPPWLLLRRCARAARRTRA